MTVTSKATWLQYNGTGSVSTFPYDWRILADDDLAVVRTSDTGADTTLTLNTDYTVTGAGEEAGGNVVLTVALPLGYKLTIYSNMDVEQPTDFTNQDAFFLESVETALDRQCMISRQLATDLIRCVRLPSTSGSTGDALGDALLTVEDSRDAAAASAAAAAVSAATALAAQGLAEDARDTAVSSASTALIASAAAVAAQGVAEALSGDKPPIGSIFLARDGDLCEGVLECAGAAVSRTTYKDLFSGSGVFPFDLTTAQFLDEKGSITTLTVDTADTSGHFDAAKSARVVAGCRIVIAGTSYPIVSISGDGTANNSVVFSGTLSTGAKTVTAIYGAELSGGAVRLARFLTRTNTDVCIGGSASASGVYNTSLASDAVDGVLAATTTDSWVVNAVPSVSAPVWWQYQFVNPRRIWKLRIYCAGYAARAPKSFTVMVSDTGAFSGEESVVLTVSNFTSWSAGNWYEWSIASPCEGEFIRISITANNGDSTYTEIDELEMYEESYTYPANCHYSVALPALDSTDWSALKALTRTETLNSQFIWYALSFDGGTTYSAFVSSAWLPIVRNNAGTWEYWDGSAWMVASSNSALGAMALASLISGNRMTGATMAGLSQAQIEGSGGFVPLTQTSLPVLVALYSASTTATPVLGEVKAITDPSIPSMPIGTTFGSGDGSTTFNLPNLTPPTGCMYVITYK